MSLHPESLLPLLRRRLVAFVAATSGTLLIHCEAKRPEPSGAAPTAMAAPQELNGGVAQEVKPAGTVGGAAPPAGGAGVVPASAAAADAKALFAQRCTMCHGLGGKGDGPASATLSPRPRDYTDAAWQGAVSDDELRKAIVGGGPAVGKSLMMPPNPDLQSRPELVTELVKIVRSFKR